MTISQALAVAFRNHRAGQLQGAEQICRQILEVEPAQPNALHLMGLIALQTGRFKMAVEFLQRAIAAHRTDAIYHLNLGKAYRALGMNSDAIACYQQAILLNPNLTAAHYNLGLLLSNCGRFDDAVNCFQQALQLAPGFVEGYRSLGQAFRSQGNYSDAINCFQSALRRAPDHASIYNDLGIAFVEQGRWSEGATCFQEALRLIPEHANAHNNLGVALYEQGELFGAVGCYRRAIQFKPDHTQAYNNLGTALEELGQFVEAADCLRHAVRLQPDDAGSLMQLVHLHQSICLWGDLLVLSQRVIQSVEREPNDASAFPASPFSFLALPTQTTAKQQLQCASQWVEHQMQSAVRIAQHRTMAWSPRTKPKIKIGYLSADFRSHPVAEQIVDLFENQDRRRFEIVGYSYGPDDSSPMRHRIEKSLDRFVDINSLSFEEAANRIRQDEVDILVDLTGYTQHGRAQILAFRPAPIQINYLGYLATMGASFVDYILVDDFVVPLDQQVFFTEKLIQLPGCFQVNSGQREISPQTPSRAECGLPQDGFVFCCFNNNYKIAPEMFNVWMKLLDHLPGSVLWLTESNPQAPENLRREAEKRGVAAERLIFTRNRPLPEYRAQYRLVDLFLDTFPYNAGATASDALWVGCPVLTLTGETFVSRMAGSLLHTLGLPELITTSLEEYHDVAVRLALDRESLSNLRARLTTNRSTSDLFDTEHFARSLEKAYVAMWEIHASGRSPQPMTIR